MDRIEHYRENSRPVKRAGAPCTQTSGPERPRRYYLSPILIERAAIFARSKGNLASLGGLVLALNALHAAAAADGLVLVGQEYVARAAGGMSIRWIKARESELAEAGLVRRREGPGRRRILELVSADELSGAFHNLLPKCGEPETCAELVENSDLGCKPLHPEGARLCTLHDDPLKVRARVQKEEGELRRELIAEADRADLLDALSALAKSSRATSLDASRLASAAAELERLLGTGPAAAAIVQIRPWVLRVAHSNPAALALRAIQARSRRAADRSSGQGSLFG